MKYFLIIISLVLFQRAVACDCPVELIEKDYIYSDFVGSGTILKIEEFDSLLLEVTIETEIIYKGENQIKFYLEDPRVSSCGLNINLNDKWIFFAIENNGKFYISQCSHSNLFSRFRGFEIDFLQNPTYHRLSEVIFDLNDLDIQPKISASDSTNIVNGYLSDSKEVGTVYVAFVIDVYGHSVNPTILQGVNEQLDNEAIKIVGRFENAIPGIIKSQSVSSKYIVPIRFKK